MPLSKSQKADIYRQFLPMATHLAVKFSRRRGLPINEMITEAHSLLGENIARWNELGTDPIKAATSSTSHWVYIKLYYGLQDYIARKRDRALPMSALERDDNPVQMPAKQPWLGRLCETLGEDARILIDTILHAPSEIADDISSSASRRSREAVRRYLKTHGWTEQRLNMAWTEVEACL